MNQKHDVFISYSSKDKDVAFYLCDKIEEQDIKCWIAPRNEIAGMTYARQILQAIENSSVVLVCFSTNANTSEHVESEVDIAYCAGKVIIPFRIDECEMSAGLRYYLNKKHWLNGIPVNEQAVEKLINSIVVNIPKYAKLHEMERSVDNAIVVVSNLVSESEDLDTAISMQNNDNMVSRLDKLKQLYNSIQKLEENLIFGSVIRSFIEEDVVCLNDSVKGDPSYDLLVNAKGELILITSSLKGAPIDSLLVYDEDVNNILLKKNEDCVVRLENISQEVFPYLKRNGKILVVEVNDENLSVSVTNEYYATIKSYSTNNLHQSHNLTKEQISSNPENRYNILSDKEGRVTIIISAMEGAPNNCRGIYDGKKLLIVKNQEVAHICDNLNAKAIEAFEKVETITIIETFRGEPVAEYDMRIFSTDYITI